MEPSSSEPPPALPVYQIPVPLEELNPDAAPPHQTNNITTLSEMNPSSSVHLPLARTEEQSSLITQLPNYLGDKSIVQQHNARHLQGQDIETVIGQVQGVQDMENHSIEDKVVAEHVGQAVVTTATITEQLSPERFNQGNSGGEQPLSAGESVRTHLLDGEQYVTVVQDGQTYAIPLADYEAMIKYDPPPSSNNQFEKNQAGINNSEMSMRFLEADTSFEGTNKRKIVTNLSLQKPFKTALRPIKVDNWGIFLLNRLQNCFQRKELCDLTIRFPDRNAQIKVHKLVVNACTEYFTTAEKDGKLHEGIIDMPANFLPDAMAPIIRFMYTGKLELKEELFNRLYETAMLLNMSVLTKLMDTQVNTPVDPDRKGKRKSYKVEDPLSEAKKFKKMEEVVRHEEAKVQKLEKLKGLYKIKQEKEELEKQKLPGKKLPIWKKRVFGGEGTRIVGLESSLKPNYIVNQPIDSEKSKDQTDAETLEEVSSKPSPSTPYKIPRVEQQIIQPALSSHHVPATYARRVSPDKPKFPRRLREINEHLMFEKILRTGSKNSVMMKEGETVTASTMSAEEIKELGQEQAQRKMVDDDDDYFDNDAEFVADEYNEDVDSPAPMQIDNSETIESKQKTQIAVEQDSEHQLQPQESEHQLQPQPPIDPEPATMLAINEKQASNEKAEDNSDPSRKTLMFNIKPDPTQAAPARSQHIAEAEDSEPQHNQETITTLEDELDDALDEFSRVAEEEARELEDHHQTETKKPRRGRPPKWMQEKAVKVKKENTHAASIPKPKALVEGDQSKVIAEILKKYPNILKENKSVKIKVSVMENGKPTIQTITLKPQVANKTPKVEPLDPLGVQFNPGTGLRNLPKVLYTGRRGRPKKLRDGEVDPHADERRKIKENLLKNCPNLARQIDDVIDQYPSTTSTDGAEQKTFSFESTQFVDPEGLGQYCQPAHENQGLAQLHPMDQIREHTTNTSSLQLQQANITDGQTGMVDFSGSMMVDGGGAQYLVPHAQEYIHLIEGNEENKYVYVMDLKGNTANLVVPHQGPEGSLVMPQGTDASMIMAPVSGTIVLPQSQESNSNIQMSQGSESNMIVPQQEALSTMMIPTNYIPVPSSITQSVPLTHSGSHTDTANMIQTVVTSATNQLGTSTSRLHPENQHLQGVPGTDTQPYVLEPSVPTTSVAHSYVMTQSVPTSAATQSFVMAQSVPTSAATQSYVMAQSAPTSAAAVDKIVEDWGSDDDE